MNLAKLLILYFLTPVLLTPPPQGGAQQSAPPTAQTSTSATAPTPKRTHHKNKKKTASTNCATAPTTGGPSPAPATASAGASNLPPCPTPKKVIRNGGSAEPSIQLVGGAASAQNDQQRKIDELTAATAENLKKLEGRPLKPIEQDTVTQIKQFMAQSKSAAAEGDMERGNNLAMKARLLSDELVKP